MNKQLNLPEHNNDVLILYKHNGIIGYMIGYYDHMRDFWAFKRLDTYFEILSYVEILNWQEIPDIMRLFNL